MDGGKASELLAPGHAAVFSLWRSKVFAVADQRQFLADAALGLPVRHQLPAPEPTPAQSCGGYSRQHLDTSTIRHPPSPSHSALPEIPFLLFVPCHRGGSGTSAAELRHMPGACRARAFLCRGPCHVLLKECFPS